MTRQVRVHAKLVCMIDDPSVPEQSAVEIIEATIQVGKQGQDGQWAWESVGTYRIPLCLVSAVQGALTWAIDERARLHAGAPPTPGAERFVLPRPTSGNPNWN